MSVRILILNSIIVAIGVPFLLFAWLAPFDFFVDIKSIEYMDVCAGENVQIVVSLRDVRWSDSYEGKTIDELVKYDEDLIQETIIKREATFIYQKSDIPVQYQIEWDHKLPAGEYGVNSNVTIDTIFKKKDFRSHYDQQFTVYECE